MSKVTNVLVVLAIVVAVAIVWLTTAPVVANAEGRVGGYQEYWIPKNTLADPCAKLWPCNALKSFTCPDGPPGYNCTGGMITDCGMQEDSTWDLIYIGGGKGAGCGPLPTQPCSGTMCVDVYDQMCFGLE